MPESGRMFALHCNMPTFPGRAIRRRLRLPVPRLLLSVTAYEEAISRHQTAMREQ